MPLDFSQPSIITIILMAQAIRFDNLLCPRKLRIFNDSYIALGRQHSIRVFIRIKRISSFDMSNRVTMQTNYGWKTSGLKQCRLFSQ
jgi:hypothetical protein